MQVEQSLGMAAVGRMGGAGMDARTIRKLKPELDAFLERFDDCFKRQPTREHLAVYVRGQLSAVQRKNVEAMALDQQVPVRTLQEFLVQYKWDEDLMRTRVHEIVRDEFPHAHSVGIIDETSDDKKGDKTPGVQRQHLGCSGKQDNGIVTVHLAYAADNFHCVLDGELFLPEGWSQDRARCREAGVPDEVVYRSKSDIALELHARAVANGVKLRWLTFDEWYGAKPVFLRTLHERKQLFVGETPCSFVAWTKPPAVATRPYRKGGKGRPRSTPRLAANSPPPRAFQDLVAHDKVFTTQAWQPWRIRDGEQGPMVWEAKVAPIWIKDADGLPIGPWQLLVCRNTLNRDDVKYFISNAPADTPVETLLLVAFSRWRVERCFQDQKGEVGLDHYEGRRYLGLKRHLILSMVSYLFLSHTNQRLRGEKSGVDSLPSQPGRERPGDLLVA
jgi:SRSO17 transposase